MAVDQRHHVLQLIAKTERTAGLIKRRAGPDAARKRLIQKPAVEHCVQRRIGSSDFDRGEKFVPMTQYLFKRAVDTTRPGGS